jgi:hypothetical protein
MITDLDSFAIITYTLVTILIVHWLYYVTQFLLN